MKATLTFKNKDNWSGFSIYRNCRHGIGPYIKRSGVLYTGLEDEVLRKELEKDLPGVDLKTNSGFWDTFMIFLTDKNLILDTDIPEQKLKYYHLKGHKDVAFGLNDKKPSAKYVLLQAEEEAKEVNTKARIKRKAISEFDKLTTEQMKKALRLYGYSSSNSSSEVVESILFKLVEENPNKFLNLWVNNINKETQFLIEEAVSKGIFRKSKTLYKYGTDVLGHSLEDAVDYLNKLENSDLKLSIKAQLQNKDVTLGKEKETIENSTSQFTTLMNEIDKEDNKVKD